MRTKILLRLIWNNDRFDAEYLSYHQCVFFLLFQITTQKVVASIYITKMMTWRWCLCSNGIWSIVMDKWCMEVLLSKLCSITINVIKRVEGEMTHTVLFDWTHLKKISIFFLLQVWVISILFETHMVCTSMQVLNELWNRCYFYRNVFFFSFSSFTIFEHFQLIKFECDNIQIQWIYKSDKILGTQQINKP